MGKITDVWPDGRSYNLIAMIGMVRARYRNGESDPSLIKPGELYKYTLDLKAISNVFKAGHRIRVQICSSSFPLWDRNLNTGNPIGQDSEIEVAVQTIFHNSLYPSHLVLPVIRE
jgi:putative CocE/NonD family hydrolase